LLVEGAATNQLISSNALGSGWSPTFTGTLNGITNTQTTGTENGFFYVQYDVSGTATASGALDVGALGSNRINVSTGQTWTGSAYYRFVSGSLANTTISQLLNVEETTGTVVVGSTPATINFTNTITRLQSTRTMGGTAVTARLAAIVQWNNGAVINFSIRLYAPQYEQTSAASSYIPTTGASATRAVDTALISNLANIGFNATQGTFVVEFEPQQVQNNVTSGILDVYLDINNFIRLRQGTANGTSVNFEVTIAGVTTTIGTAAGAMALGSITKVAFAYQSGNYAVSFNGAAAITNALVGVPTVNALEIGGSPNLANKSTWVRRVIYIPTRTPDAQLPALAL
jgi:hypothetical protein